MNEQTDARMQLHWAAQAAASVGRTLIPPAPDDSHHSFQWSEKHEALMQGAIPGPRSLRSGLRLRDLTLILGADDGTVLSFPLRGRTLADGYGWLTEQTGGAELIRGEGIPAHPVAEGEAFDADARALQSLEVLYRDAAMILPQFGDAVRCWPHHFDIATLLQLEKGRTIGIGMVPGDEYYDHPYWYVTPWPYPEDLTGLPELPAPSFWHTDRWVGAVLPALDQRADEVSRTLMFIRHTLM